MQKDHVACRAWLISIFVHLCLFVLLAASGMFMLIRPEAQGSEPVDVAIVDLPAGGGAQSGDAGEASAEAGAPPSMEIALPTQLPAIREDYTQKPQLQQAYRQRQQQPAADAAGSAKEASAGDAVDAGTSQGSGRKESVGGTGSGHARGHGAGTGTGKGTDRGDGSAVPAGSGRVAARCVHQPVPAYPEELRRQGVEGAVQVQILVAADDSIEQVEVIQSSGYPAMDAAAVSAAYGCRFQMNGSRGRYTTTYAFRLDAADDW